MGFDVEDPELDRLYTMAADMYAFIFGVISKDVAG